MLKTIETDFLRRTAGTSIMLRIMSGRRNEIVEVTCIMVGDLKDNQLICFGVSAE